MPKQLMKFFIYSILFFPVMTLADTHFYLAGLTKHRLESFLVSSEDDGITFSKSLDFPNDIKLRDIKCFGSGLEGGCLAGGKVSENIKNPKELVTSILTKWGNNPWQFAKISGELKDDSHLNSFNCTSTATTCVAIFDASFSRHSQVFYSNDKGKNWHISDESNHLAGNLHQAACIGTDSSSAICVATGSKWDDTESAFLSYVIESDNGGKTWYEPFIDREHDNHAKEISCTGEGNNSTCVIANEENSLWIGKFIEGKLKWNNYRLSTEQANYRFCDITCHDSGKSAWCVTSGIKTVNYHSTPVIVYSHDAGMSWQETALAPPGGFDFCVRGGLDPNRHELSCSDKICVTINTRPNNLLGRTLAQSKDHGATWTFQNVPKPSSQYPYFLENITCSDSNKSVCIAAGYVDGKDHEPFLISTVDNGMTWSVIKNPDNFPKYGLFTLGSSFKT